MSVRPPGGTLRRAWPLRLLGVAGSIQDVRLVLLTTEPGGRDPPRFGTMTAHGSPSVEVNLAGAKTDGWVVIPDSPISQLLRNTLHAA
jgi:hypothetical protein